jgi:O-acetyl-ADP-ribose deacetylase (regulator of RNase III)
MKTIRANILNQTRGILVHGVNAQGVMGAGFAKQLKLKYPRVYFDYKVHYLCRGLNLGNVITTTINSEFIVVSGVTQQYYGRNPNVIYVDYPAVETVFDYVNTMALMSDLPVIFPSIGVGLANGNWTTIESIIERALEPTLDITHFVYP